MTLAMILGDTIRYTLRAVPRRVGEQPIPQNDALMHLRLLPLLGLPAMFGGRKQGCNSARAGTKGSDKGGGQLNRRQASVSHVVALC